MDDILPGPVVAVPVQMWRTRTPYQEQTEPWTHHARYSIPNYSISDIPSKFSADDPVVLANKVALSLTPQLYELLSRMHGSKYKLIVVGNPDAQGVVAYGTSRGQSEQPDADDKAVFSVTLDSLLQQAYRGTDPEVLVLHSVTQHDNL